MQTQSRGFARVPSIMAVPAGLVGRERSNLGPAALHSASRGGSPLMQSSPFNRTDSFQNIQTMDGRVKPIVQVHPVPLRVLHILLILPPTHIRFTRLCLPGALARVCPFVKAGTQPVPRWPVQWFQYTFVDVYICARLIFFILFPLDLILSLFSVLCYLITPPRLNFSRVFQVRRHV